MFVGGLEDGIDDAELKRYFSEFGFVTRALRIPNKDGPKRKFGKNFRRRYEALLIGGFGKIYVMAGSAKAIGREPKTCLGRVFNYKLGCYDDVHVFMYTDAHPSL